MNVRFVSALEAPLSLVLKRNRSQLIPHKKTCLAEGHLGMPRKTLESGNAEKDCENLTPAKAGVYPFVA